MIALRDFRYGDRQTGKSVQIEAGQHVDADVLAKHKCDIDKLERTKFLARGEAPSEGPLKTRKARRK